MVNITSDDEVKNAWKIISERIKNYEVLEVEPKKDLKVTKTIDESHVECGGLK